MANIKNEKTVKKWKCDALGFPVIIHNVRIKKIMGEWCPLIKWELLMKTVILALMTKPSHITGSEIKFIRTYFKLTYSRFGEILGISHQAVKKWELTEDQPTKMQIPTERNVRLFILDSIFSKEIKTLKEFKNITDFILHNSFAEKQKPKFEIDSSELEAA